MDFKNITTVVFAGGGVRGLAFVGALQTLRDVKGIDFGARIPKPAILSGVSIGSLFALMINIGFTVAEITEISSNLKQSELISHDPLRILSGELSIDDGSRLRNFVKLILDKKRLSSEITFKELFDTFDGISLHVLVSDLTNAKVIQISEKSHPNVKIMDGITASMSIPFVFPPVVSPEGDLWVDGGILENFPVTRYDPETLLGFDFTVKIDCVADNLINLFSRVLYVQQVPLDFLSKKLMSAKHLERCVFIETGNITSLQNFTDLSQETRKLLLKAGSDAMRNKMKSAECKENKLEYEGLPHYIKCLIKYEPTFDSYINK